MFNNNFAPSKRPTSFQHPPTLATQTTHLAAREHLHQVFLQRMHCTLGQLRAEVDGLAARSVKLRELGSGSGGDGAGGALGLKDLGHGGQEGRKGAAGHGRAVQLQRTATKQTAGERSGVGAAPR